MRFLSWILVKNIILISFNTYPIQNPKFSCRIERVLQNTRPKICEIVVQSNSNKRIQVHDLVNASNDMDRRVMLFVMFVAMRDNLDMHMDVSSCCKLWDQVVGCMRYCMVIFR